MSSTNTSSSVQPDDIKTVKLVPCHALSNDILFNLKMLNDTKNPIYLQELQQIIKEVEPMFEKNPLPDHPGLRAFATPGTTPFTGELALKAEAEYKSLWRFKGVEEVNGKRILLLKEGLIFAEHIIEYESVKPFIAEGCFRLSKAPYIDRANGSQQDSKLYKETLVQLINDTFDNLERTASVPLISTKDEEKVIPQIFVNKIEELQQGLRRVGKQLKEAVGDGVIPETLHEIHAHMADATDTDSMRAGLTQLHRFNAISWRQILGHAADEDLEQLKKMAKRLAS
jgi:hypothetical protein